MKWMLLVFLCTALSAQILIREDSNLPLTHINFTFQIGSSLDPKGKEGLSHLAARWVREGGVKAWRNRPQRTRAEFEEFLFPYGIEIAVQNSKEQIVFKTSAPKEYAEEALLSIAQLLLSPLWEEATLSRIKAETNDFLTKQAPLEDQEELGKSGLTLLMYGKEHPYSHMVEGKYRSLKEITGVDIMNFYQEHFTRDNLMLGVSGHVPRKLSVLVSQIHKMFRKKKVRAVPLPKSADAPTRELLFLKGPFDSVGVHAGHVLPITRADRSFPALYLSSVAFGKHRSFVGRLMRQVRELRGLNYGTYAYVEDFPRGGQLLMEPTGVARRQQAFTVWARPTTLENGCFLTRQIAFEVDRFAREGISAEEFATTKSHLLGYLPQLIKSSDRYLEYLIDSHFYRMKSRDPIADLRSHIARLKLDEVNAAVKSYIHPEKLKFVITLQDPKKMQEELNGASCEIRYGSGVVPSSSQKDEDSRISKFLISVPTENIQTLESTELN